MKQVKPTELTSEQKELFYAGTKYMKGYIAFCIAHYPYQMNLSGITRFFKELTSFLMYDGSYISNNENLTFGEYIETYLPKF